ncbi:NAD-dependent epimerase [Solimonas sp. K1W22B-7]|uniref:NAD-dependent epimerase n=1 Tax=Solimonas sp. K1W22B-7 TaxID=2303331 RepID=UPI000E337093|nr:NAD-dependent epimerase [Solimonas sp. K1W22B-7]AXQ29924.1 NAD-dependent epimerase [Solimonas sp. K1W22B-7]
MKVLVTGAAGFVGFYCTQHLLDRGDEVVGYDNLNDYYDPALKRARLQQLQGRPGFRFVQADLADMDAMSKVFADWSPDVVLNLGAQAGVRYSLQNPRAYVDSNLTGFVNILECCRQYPVKHLVYASSSSVYGANTKVPFAITDTVDHPVSLYAATKKSNEALAHSYSHLFGIPTTGLRFFTVYGPWGRPDMAYFSFTKALFEGKPIDVFNHGDMERDFTYIDDIVTGVIRTMDRLPAADPSWTGDPPQLGRSSAPYRLYNIGNHSPVKLMHFIQVLEKLTGREAQKNFKPMAQGDVYRTYADVDDLKRDVGFEPSTSIEEGLSRFVAWYREYYRV